MEGQRWARTKYWRIHLLQQYTYSYSKSHFQHVPQRSENVHANHIFLISRSSNDLLQKLRFHNHIEILFVLFRHIVRKMQIRLHVTKHGTNDYTGTDTSLGIRAIQLDIIVQ